MVSWSYVMLAWGWGWGALARQSMLKEQLNVYIKAHLHKVLTSIC